jgi:hypothetical protein
MKIDQTKWYSIDYEEVEKVAIEKGVMNPFQEVTPIGSGQIGQGAENPHEIGEKVLISSVTDNQNTENQQENPMKSAENTQPMPIGVAKLDSEGGQIGQGYGQIGHMDVAKMTKPLPEIIKENKKEIKKNSITNDQNFILTEIETFLNQESFNGLPEEIKTTFDQPIKKFLNGFHLTAEQAEEVGELIIDVCRKCFNEYEVNDVDKFRGLIYRSIENGFLDHLLINVKGVDVAKFLVDGREKELEKMRKNVKMEYLFSLTNRNEELAPTKEVNNQKPNKPKQAKKSYQKNSYSRKLIRTELLPDWFEDTPKKDQWNGMGHVLKDMLDHPPQKTEAEIIAQKLDIERMLGELRA